MAALIDVIVVGAGPAGMTAALSVARQQQSVVLFDDGKYRNDRTEYMHLIPGFDHVRPSDFRAQARANITTNYDQVTVQNAALVRATKDDAGIFTVQDDAGHSWRGKKLILANGVEDLPPPLDGYADCWGISIFHCLYCKGYEQRGGASAGVLAIGGVAKAPVALHVARQVASLSRHVTIYTDGATDLAEEIAHGLGTAQAMTVDARKIQRLVPQSPGAGVQLQFADGSTATETFLAHTPATKPRGPFAEQLGLARLPTGDVQAGPPFYQTSVPGVYAAGDVCGMMKNVPHAIFSGSLAGMGASSQIVAEALGQKPLFG